jgi:uncharacterized protein YndB with AHSA1/START domain
VRGRAARSPLGECSTLYFARSIQAERRRVFCALTVPEYIESWLTIPGAVLGGVLLTHNQSFSIFCLDGQDAHFTIRCSYKVCKRAKLVLDWKHDSIHSLHPCLVKIRLMGEFERTNLELIHVGLDQSMLEWHRELWETSLTRLSSLF